MKKIYFIFTILLLATRTITADCDECKKFFGQSSLASQEQILKLLTKCNLATRLAFYCHELTLDEVKAVFKDLEISDLYKKSDFSIKIIDKFGLYSELTPKQIIEMKIQDGCKSEGCLYLYEQLQNAEKKERVVKQQITSQYNSYLFHFKDDLYRETSNSIFLPDSE